MENWPANGDLVQSEVEAGLRSAHELVGERKGRKPLADIKVMKEDPAAVEAQSDHIKAKYTAIFGV